MSARVTQAPVEVLASPSTAAVRITQAPVEVLLTPPFSQVRATQAILEILIGPPRTAAAMPAPMFPAVWITGFARQL